MGVGGCWAQKGKRMVDLNSGDWVRIDVGRSRALMGIAIW